MRQPEGLRPRCPDRRQLISQIGWVGRMVQQAQQDPNISNHLACLRGCGLVRTVREGRQVRYELASPRLAHALADLVDLDLHIEAHHADLDGRV